MQAMQIQKDDVNQDCTQRIILGDCLNVLREMADNSVDLVVTSPPYEDARTYEVVDLNRIGLLCES